MENLKNIEKEIKELENEYLKKHGKTFDDSIAEVMFSADFTGNMEDYPCYDDIAKKIYDLLELKKQLEDKDMKTYIDSTPDIKVEW